jgi:hypothetical protein
MRRVAMILLPALVLLGGGGIALGASPSPGTTTAVPSASPIPMMPTGLLLWPAPPDPLDRTVAAGLTPERVESLTYHVHAGLMIFLDGEPVAIPAGIGIDILNPGVQSFAAPDGTAYGGISGCDVPCISPLHTHDWFGVLHIESSRPVPIQLGQFFLEWGVRLDPGCVGQFCAPATPIAIEVDGVPFTGDPGTIELADHLLITIVIGTPPAVVPTAFDYNRP